MERTITAAVVLGALALAVVTGAVGAAGAEPAGVAESTPAGTGEPAATGQPHISGLYPNPATEGDRGEFVTVVFPPDANLAEYRLADGQTSVPLSPRVTNTTGMNITGDTLDTPTPDTRTVTFSTDPGLTEWLTGHTVAPLPGSVQLANGGETVRLLRRAGVVDEVAYESAPESDRYDTATGGWEPLGATDRPVVTATGGTVETFVLPDEPDRARTLLESATERILLAGYTLTSQRVVDALSAALDRGVTVEVLVDGAPVGGMTGDGAAALSELDRAGATVRVFAGNRERYRYHHAKYAVVDDRALVTSENWKPSGTGGASNRGWGVVTGQERIVEGLVDTYRADAGWVDTVSWAEFDPALVESDPSTGGHPQEFERERLPVERTRLLVTPDNAGRVVRDRIESAEETVDIKQVRIGDRELPLLQAALDAAARGVEVRILLSSAWYAREQNEQLAAWLRDRATAADLPLTVRLADPDGAFGRIHAKGVVIDGEQALVGSINWNRNAVRNNREVALLLEGEAAGYFGSVFDADWQRGRSDGRDIPLGLTLAVLAAAVTAVLAAKHIRFER